MEYLILIKNLRILVNPKSYIKIVLMGWWVCTAGKWACYQDDDLGPIQGTDMVERDNQLLKFDLQKYIIVHIWTCTNNIHTQTDSNTINT